MTFTYIMLALLGGWLVWSGLAMLASAGLALLAVPIGVFNDVVRWVRKDRLKDHLARNREALEQAERALNEHFERKYFGDRPIRTPLDKDENGIPYLK